ncbi:unnamed protein product [Acanthoscelides obtectus]|uniref:DDE Tnp4 domain-containing protein n=1 Tax=Acanthoscelides obtectus TaxID=200917 RepID=A0A9P0VV36_ACAOB|nr:unnamed protein product [Acanthoscelides obtectus]CAK1685812.1 Protein ALP1-like [Acanthoscelides obtectus]
MDDRLGIAVEKAMDDSLGMTVKKAMDDRLGIAVEKDMDGRMWMADSRDCRNVQNSWAVLPRTSSDWLRIEKGFRRTWNFPHCLGAIDGKHVLIQSPIHSGSEFINYHKTFSVVLMALVDADYNFIFVDCGCQGRISDGGVYRNTNLYKQICRKELGFPPPDCLPLKVTPLPYVLVADSAFALTENMMKPYAGTHNKGSKERVFNYRLSRARRIVENVFGIMSAVFRVLRKPMLLQPDIVTDIVMTCALLHNFLRRSKRSRLIYTPPGSFDTENDDGEIQPGSWRDDQNGVASLLPLQNGQEEHLFPPRI